MNTINKLTSGYVSQEFSENGELLSQKFTPGDDVVWEDENGNLADEPEDMLAAAFDMVQPKIIPPA